MDDYCESPWTAKPKELHIVWGDHERYWEINEDEARLRTVCWFDVSFTFDNVTMGEYSIVLQGKSVTRNDFPVTVIVKDGTNKTIIQEEITSDQITEEGLSCCKFILENQGSCQVSLQNHTRVWKGGLNIKKITLQPTIAKRFLKTKSAAKSTKH